MNEPHWRIFSATFRQISLQSSPLPVSPHIPVFFSIILSEFRDCQPSAIYWRVGRASAPSPAVRYASEHSVSYVLHATVTAINAFRPSIYWLSTDSWPKEEIEVGIASFRDFSAEVVRIGYVVRIFSQQLQNVISDTFHWYHRGSRGWPPD